MPVEDTAHVFTTLQKTHTVHTVKQYKAGLKCDEHRPVEKITYALEYCSCWEPSLVPYSCTYLTVAMFLFRLL